MNNIIECKNLTLAYDGAVVIRNLSFNVSEGEILLVSGENGSGKSTLIKAMTGLIKPVSGSITVNGKRKIGYLPQQSGIGKDFPATVKEIVSQGFTGSLKYGIFMPRDASERMHRAMHLTGIEKLKSKCFSELSGGQQQRVLLSRALCAADDMLILDEPTNGLDPESCAHMYGIITSLKKDLGMTVIMVSHDLETSVTLADRVLHLCCDGAFCCAAEEYDEMLKAAHDKNLGGVSHECNCGCPHDSGKEDAE